MTRNRSFIVAIASIATAGCVAGGPQADTIRIPAPEGVEVRSQTVEYVCAGRTIAVRYINAGSVALAVMELAGEQIVASNVIAASGARYAARQYVWWNKGSEAFLQDLMKGEDAPVLKCTAR